MSYSKHDHLPSPFVPASCQECYPPRLSELMPSGPMGTTSATAEILSDIASILRAQLRDSQEEVRTPDRTNEDLQAQIAELKHDLRATKADAREAGSSSAQLSAEKAVIIEALHQANVRESG